MLVMAASVTVGLVRRGVLAAYDVRKRFVVTMVMTVWLVYRSSLGTIGMVQAIAWLIVRSRLWLVLVVGSMLCLLSCGVILLVPVTRSACVIFVWVL